MKKCSVNHRMQARPDANQPLKLQDWAALKSLVLDRRTSLIPQHFAQSSTAVAVQTLTALTVMLPPSKLWEAYWLESKIIINAARALAVVVHDNAPATLLTCLGSQHALISLKFTSKQTQLSSADNSDPSKLMHCIMHLTAQQDPYPSCRGLQRLLDSIGHMTALQTLSLNDRRDLIRLPDTIVQLIALKTLLVNSEACGTTSGS